MFEEFYQQGVCFLGDTVTLARRETKFLDFKIWEPETASHWASLGIGQPDRPCMTALSVFFPNIDLCIIPEMLKAEKTQRPQGEKKKR